MSRTRPTTERGLVRHAAGVVLLLVALTGCRTDIQSGIDEANDLLYREQYVAADQLYRRLLKRLEAAGELDDEGEGQRLLILDRLGKVNSIYLHDANAAIGYYQLLVRLYPKSEQAIAARSTIADIYHHRLGDLQAAIDTYQKLISDFPTHAEARRGQLQMANAYFQLRNYEQARAEAEQLVNRWPKSDEAVQARFQIANSYYVQARIPQAVATYERLLEDQPPPSLAALVLFELGNCFQELDQPERALAYYYACLNDHPDPLTVQRRIQKIRARLSNIRPLPQIELPDYLRQRLANPGDGGVRPRLQVSDGSGVMHEQFVPGVPQLAPKGGPQSSTGSDPTLTPETPTTAPPPTPPTKASPPSASPPPANATPPSKKAPAPAPPKPAPEPAPPTAPDETPAP